MPQVRIPTKSKIPVAGMIRRSKKSQSENLKPEVNKPKRNETFTVQPTVPAADEAKRRHLSVVEVNNTRNGSKSSVSDLDGEVFHTAGKDVEINENPRGGRVFAKSSKEKVVAEKQKNSKFDKKSATRSKPKKSSIILNINLGTADEATTHSSNSSSYVPKIKLEEDVREPLPEGVINIEVEDGLYEYSREVVVYLMEMEIAATIPTDFLDDGSVSANMRSILVDWLIQVQHHLKMCQETLYLAIGMLDMVLHRRDVDPDKLQLVGVTAFLVASKLEEYYPVDIKKLLHLTENSYSRVEVTHMERVLLEILEFKVNLPSPQVFLLRYTRASFRSEDFEFLKTCQYLLDSHLPHPSHPCQPPSLLAAAAVLSSSLLYSLSVNSSSPPPTTIWTSTLVHYTKYNLMFLIPTSLQMVEQVLNANLSTCKYTGAMVKYKSLSQHQRLALSKHLHEDVLRRAIQVLEHWGQ
eukprot:GFUD01040382.1.p1 GENE.GFUD01040382.1~~GFUD01040382.1.p1  ORF type:complete len:466 (+),score=113.22 GFUD01040382.1:95-1492(+)